MRRSDVFVFCSLLSSLTLITILEALFVPPVSAPTTRYVPTQYPTISTAIAEANPGDTIFVYNGTYHEHVSVDKRLTLAGQNRDITIIDGSATGTVVDIQADNVDIHGFTIQNGGRRYNAILIGSTYDNIEVSDNIIKNSVTGVSISESDGNKVIGNTFFNNSIKGISLTYSLGNNISNNAISDSAYAIKLDQTNTTLITGNTVSSSSYGIYVGSSTGNTITNNILSGNSFGILTYLNSNTLVKNNTVSGSTYAIEVHTSTSISVLNNKLTNNPSYSIYLAYSDGNTVKGNSVSLSDWGIDLYDSSGNTIAQNTVSDNTYGFYITNNAGGNSIYHNNIIDNVKQVLQELSSPNTWNTPTTPFQGNYWSDYRGTDTNGDGIGDTFLPWGAVDWYPLINPVGVGPDIAIISVTPARDRTYLGLSINVTVVVKNQGGMSATFSVTAYYNQSTIGTKSVTSLAPDASVALIFTWNTTGVNVDHYVISANATTVPFETDITNNSLTDGTIYVKKLGDINGDGKVDILDGVLLSANYARPVEEFPDGDINGDGEINVLDAVLLATNWTG